MSSIFFTTFAVTCKHQFFGLVPWYKYLDLDNKCNIVNFDLLNAKDVSLILLAVVDDLLRLAGLLAIGYVIYGAIRYILSQGSPEETAKAQSTIINALVGLAIAMLAVGIVSFLGNQLS
jgi:hypothetical protein